MPTDVAVEISGHVAQENQNQHQTYESEYRKCSLFYLLYRFTRTVTQTKPKKKCYKQQDVIGFNLNLFLKLFFCLPMIIDNNLSFRIYCENVVACEYSISQNKITYK